MPTVPAFRFFALAVLAIAGPAHVPPAAASGAAAPVYRYTDVADLAIKAPMVIDATIRSATRIKGADAASTAPGFVRFYVTVDVIALIRGPAAVPLRLSYVLDAQQDSNGNLPKLKKQRVLLFARSAGELTDQIQLVAPGAQLQWSAATESMTRRIAADVAAANAPLEIVGIANAFHAAGALPGEGQSQIFLTTTGGPVSLNITRKQGTPPAWTVALTEVVGDALPPPQRDTFLWYRLACGLPAQIPTSTLAGLDSQDAAAVTEDYALVIDTLGPCRP